MPGYDDGKFSNVVFSPSITAGSTVASLSTAVSTSASAGIYTPIVEQPPVISIAPPEHPIYALIGRAASAWAHFEHVLDLIIWDLTGSVPEMIACITAQVIGAGNRFKVIESLLMHRNNPKLDQVGASLEGLKKRSFVPVEDRNRIIHDPWYLYDTKAAQFRAMPAKDPQFGVCVVDATSIKNFIETANQLAQKASEIRSQLAAALRS